MCFVYHLLNLLCVYVFCVLCIMCFVSCVLSAQSGVGVERERNQVFVRIRDHGGLSSTLMVLLQSYLFRVKTKSFPFQEQSFSKVVFLCSTGTSRYRK